LAVLSINHPEGFMQSLIVLVTLPLMLLNMLGGIVAFVWLGILGEWGVIGYGVLLIIVMPWLFALAQIPGMVPTLLGTWLIERNWRLPAIACIFVASLWTSALIVGWCSMIAVKYVRLVTEDNRVPIILWGYTVALAPLGYMASKERDNVFTGLQTLLAQLFFIALIACWMVDATPVTYMLFIAIALLTFPVLSLVMGAAEMAFDRER
jgi:hypothetical protein